MLFRIVIYLMLHYYYCQIANTTLVHDDKLIQLFMRCVQCLVTFSLMCWLKEKSVSIQAATHQPTALDLGKGQKSCTAVIKHAPIQFLCLFIILHNFSQLTWLILKLDFINKLIHVLSVAQFRQTQQLDQNHINFLIMSK